MLQADLTIRKLNEPPADRWCEANKHYVPEDAQFQGEPTSFFRVAGKGIDMVLCGPCLHVAQAMAQLKKQRRMQDAGYSRES